MIRHREPKASRGAGPQRAAVPAGAIRWTSVGLIVAALFVLMRLLPLGPALLALEAWLPRVGPWAPGLFALLYAAATVLLVPGAALTLAAGAFFGLLWGTVTVSLGSTLGAALSFLIARYLARESVARKLRRYPRFEAVDEALAQGGWKIVALLRLSPAVPFNLQNYFYGLTAIRFWPAIVTSWAAMLPGTLMYVYLGYLSRQGLQAAAGVGGAKTAGQWALLALGLLATVALTVYVTALARRRLRAQTGVLQASPPPRAAAPQPSARRRSWSSGLLALTALGFVALAACAYARRAALAGLFGPPQVKLSEAYAGQSGGRRFDHARFSRLLGKFVRAGGWVDYEGLRGQAAALDGYIAALAQAPFDELGRDEKLALLINAYNAFTLGLILEHYPLGSIRDIPAEKRWQERRWNVGGHVWSLNQIEHEQLRAKFREPRVHFALVCAAVGCPPLRREAYSGSRLEQQLAEQAEYVHRQRRWFRFRPGSDQVYLSELYKWYRGDFEQVAGSLLSYAARYAPALKQALAAGRRPTIRWLRYDWRLNSKENAP